MEDGGLWIVVSFLVFRESSATAESKDAEAERLNPEVGISSQGTDALRLTTEIPRRDEFTEAGFDAPFQVEEDFTVKGAGFVEKSVGLAGFKTDDVGLSGLGGTAGLLRLRDFGEVTGLKGALVNEERNAEDRVETKGDVTERVRREDSVGWAIAGFGEIDGA